MAIFGLNGLSTIIGGATFSTNTRRLLAGLASDMVTDKLIHKNKAVFTESGKIDNLQLQTRDYGNTIPICYGTVRISGNIIWSTDLSEQAATSATKTKRSLTSSIKHKHTEYHYLASFAIALCEGPIKSINTIWINECKVEPNEINIRLYIGSEEQEPNPLIQQVEGIENTPAFRGLAYVVIEDFDLSPYGNRIPNFAFEIIAEFKHKTKDLNLEDLIDSTVIIPGSGEFVYDTIAQYKTITTNDDQGTSAIHATNSINVHNNKNKANSLLALDQMADDLPNLKWVAPVVNWFCTSKDAGSCPILPGVESDDITTQPDTWQVSHFSRATAHQISRQKGKPIYGGTPTDNSIRRYLEELKQRGYKIMFYPMLLVDLPDKPWRGRITGKPENMINFFQAPFGYNRFILHYANLVKDLVDAFVIGSEMVGITSAGKQGRFPAVDEFILLAEQVKAVVGPQVALTYAADWSEYHHTDGGWYHMDKLWACNAIDFIGIDAYFPLTNKTYENYNMDEISQGWQSGEGFNYEYTDKAKTVRQPLAPQYAWKNIRWWWENEHIDPDGTTTPWQPKAKRIWFTEFGFPSVDCASNQPNVFYDPSSAESALPLHSKGQVDFFAQRQALYATLKHWQGSDMIEHLFLWTWDARPYPYWPQMLNTWSDGNCWDRGHWLQGKIGMGTLRQVLADLTLRTGKINNFETIVINDIIQGLVIDHTTSAASIMQILQNIYRFDVVEYSGSLAYISHGLGHRYRVNNEELVTISDELDLPALQLTRVNRFEIPGKINLSYLSQTDEYKVTKYHLQGQLAHFKCEENFFLPMVFNKGKVCQIAQKAYQDWQEKQLQVQLTLPPQYLDLKPGDIIELLADQQTQIIRVTKTAIINGRAIAIDGVRDP
jgi:hypothetical protein